MTTFSGHVIDAGGGQVGILVDRATESYPLVGSEVVVTDISAYRWLHDFTNRAVAELAKHGWGDFHYGEFPQEPRIVALIEEHRRMSGIVLGLSADEVTS